MNNVFKILSALVIASLIVSCQTEETPKKSKSTKSAKPTVEVPAFSSDSAFVYVEEQVAFGPRVPNSDAQLACAKYLSDKLKSFDFEVIEQKGEVLAYNKKKLRMINIIGRYKPENPRRVLLFAHWDTRHITDAGSEDKESPSDGANDGGSGNGVLLENARQVQLSGLNIGLDIVFFDTEDYGPPSNVQVANRNEFWCLGSQYWGANMPMENYRSLYGIGLDMVGGKGAAFPRDGYSASTAGWVQKRIWDTANKIGYSEYFVYHKIGPLIDDYLYVNKATGIPCVDIINSDLKQGGFGDFWHTHNDNLSNIDKGALKAVGQTVMHVIYNE